MSFPKPLRGSGLLERRIKRQDRVKAEQKVMRAALVRDKMQCRWPNCEYKARKLPVDACHVVRHRGLGGNPKGDRTETTSVILALCRMHHSLFDAHEIDIAPLTDRICDGPIAFAKRHPDTGEMIQFANEKILSESVERSVR